MIKHNWFINRKGEKRYCCNQAVDVSEEKLAKTLDKVTCKNCADGHRTCIPGDDERKY